MEDRGKARLGTIFVVAASLALLVSLRHERVRAGGLTPVTMRRQAPNMDLELMDGGRWKLREHRGQVMLINLWATWCGPCREEIPGLVRLSREDASKGLAVVGLSLDVGGQEKVRAFVRQLQVTYPIAFPEQMSQLADTVEAVPTTILIDRNGRVAKIYVGAVERAVFASDIDALLAEKDDAR